jgi:hypothetical protein
VPVEGVNLTHRLLPPELSSQYRTILMAEAVGLASGLLSLTIFAYNTSKSLYEAVSSFKSQRKTIRDVQSDLCSLVTVLETIREQAQCSQEVERLEISSTCDITRRVSKT